MQSILKSLQKFLLGNSHQLCWENGIDCSEELKHVTITLSDHIPVLISN